MSISDEEFQRFQNQLVDLKTRNYQLEEQNKKLTTGSCFTHFSARFDRFSSRIENGQLKSQIESFEKDSISLRLPTKVVSSKDRVVVNEKVSF